MVNMLNDLLSAFLYAAVFLFIFHVIKLSRRGFWVLSERIKLIEKEIEKLKEENHVKQD